MGSLTCAHIWLRADVHTKWGQAQTSLHKSWLGGEGQKNCPLSCASRGSNPRSSDLNSDCLTTGPRTSPFHRTRHCAHQTPLHVTHAHSARKLPASYSRWFIYYLFIEGLWPRQPHRVTSGLFTRSNLTQIEYNATHAHHTNVKHINNIRIAALWAMVTLGIAPIKIHNNNNNNVSPFGIALVKKMAN